MQLEYRTNIQMVRLFEFSPNEVQISDVSGIQTSASGIRMITVCKNQQYENKTYESDPVFSNTDGKFEKKEQT